MLLGRRASDAFARYAGHQPPSRALFAADRQLCSYTIEQTDTVSDATRLSNHQADTTTITTHIFGLGTYFFPCYQHCPALLYRLARQSLDDLCLHQRLSHAWSCKFDCSLADA